MMVCNVREMVVSETLEEVCCAVMVKLEIAIDVISQLAQPIP